MKKSFILLTLILFAVSCSKNGPVTPEPPEKKDKGKVSFAIKRTAQSNVPSEATDALVRVWNSNTGFNKVKIHYNT